MRDKRTSRKRRDPDLEELVLFMARHLVDQPEEVEVDEIRGRRSVLYELYVAPDDVGKVIGRDGRTANAMREVLRIAARRRGVDARLEIVD